MNYYIVCLAENVSTKGPVSNSISVFCFGDLAKDMEQILKGVTINANSLSSTRIVNIHSLCVKLT